MSVLRTEEQTKLAELHAVGGGMSRRYRDLIGDAAEPLHSILDETVNQRAPLLELIREAELARGDLPPAPEHEINQVRIVADRILAGLLGEEALPPRLVRSEEAWLERIEGAREEDWSENESALLDQLAAQAREAIRRLRALA